jgi:hypothetical protein
MAAPKFKSLSKKQRRLEILSEVIEGAMPLAAALVRLRDNPRPMDYLALAAAGFNAFLRGQKAYHQLKEADRLDFFQVRGEDGDFLWKEIPQALARFVYQSLERIEEMYPPSHVWDKKGIYLGYLGDQVIGWEQDPIRAPHNAATEVPLLYLIRTQETETFEAVSQCLWKKYASPHICLSYTGFEATEEEPGQVYVTPDIQEFVDRAKVFLDANSTRAYLLEGPPGTGKTTAIKYLITQLGLRSLRMDPNLLSDYSSSDTTTESAAFAVLQVTKPDVLILDDVDHMDEITLLSLLTTSRKFCKIIVGSANNKWRLDGATLRTGRFDDHIVFNALPEEVIRILLGEKFAHLSTQMSQWPISYITDFVTKAQVLGEHAALEEMAETSSRLSKIEDSINKDTKASRSRRHY